MKISILDLQKHIKLDKKEIRSLAENILTAMDEDGVELSLVFSDDFYIRGLNRQYRGKDSVTDVLAFSLREGDGLSADTSILGDVVISLETAKKEAEKRNRAIQDEVCLYLVHGILHLLGYDDEDPENRKKMKAKEKELLGLLNR